MSEALKLLFKKDRRVQRVARSSSEHRRPSGDRTGAIFKDSIANMKRHPQLDERENTASTRQHASRFAVLPVPERSRSTATEDNLSLISMSPQLEPSATTLNNAAHTAGTESEGTHNDRLLTVQRGGGLCYRYQCRGCMSGREGGVSANFPT